MLLKKFFRFLIPSVASMWIFAMYTIVDGIFVAQGVGPEALAAVNLSSPINHMIFSVGALFATGAATMISFALGRGDKKEAGQLFSQNLVMVCAVAALLSAVMLFNLEPLSWFLGATESTIDYVKEYVRYIALFAVFFMVSYNLEVQVKANGAPHVSMIGVAACGLSNILLDYVFVIRLSMGVGGAALATGLAQMFSTCIFLGYFLTHRDNVRLQGFRFHGSWCGRIMKLGIPNCVMELSGAFSVFLFNITILKVVGEKGVVCYTVLAYVFTFVINAMFGVTQGVQPLVSYYFGGKQYEKCERLFRYGMTTVLAFSLLFFGLMELCPQLVVGVFLKKDDMELFSYTLRAMRLYACSFLLMGYNIFIGGYFTAVDQPKPSFLISLCRSFLFLTGCLLLMAKLFGADGIWLATTASEALSLLLTLALWKRRKGRGCISVKNEIR